MAISYVFNPFTGTLAPVSVEAANGNIGGLYGLNVETLTGHKTLTPNTDKIYQYLDPNGTARNITLDTASATAGDRFIIRAVGNYMASYKWLQIKEGDVQIDRIPPSGVRSYIFDGTNWVSGQFPSGENNDLKYNVFLGPWADGYRHGTAIGYYAQAGFFGVAVGSYTKAITNAVALGYQADGANCGVALGHKANTNTKRYSNAIGFASECVRCGETAISIGCEFDQENNMMVSGFERQTTNNTPVILYAGGLSGSDGNWTIRAKSSLTFKIMVTARDITTGDCAAYIFDGLIKRDGADNTVMSVCRKQILYEDDVTWDCDVTANDINETLEIEVTGDADNKVQWAARLDGVETHF